MIYRPSWDTYFLGLADAASRRSTCHRLAVGAVVVDDHNRVLGVGYNGAPPGAPHCDPAECYPEGPPCTNTVHAEQNALDFRCGDTRRDLFLYCTHAPCIACVERADNARVTRIVYRRPYRGMTESLLFAAERGIVMFQGREA